MMPMEMRLQPCADCQLNENLVRGVFQFHWGVRFRMDFNQTTKVERKIADVEAMRAVVESGSQADIWLTCRVCSYSVADLDTMIDHLAEVAHISKEDELRRFFYDHSVQDSSDVNFNSRP